MKRNWWDPWCLMAEMAAYTAGAIIILIIEVVGHFSGELELPIKQHIMYNFKQRMKMVYTTIPFYLQQLENIETYNKEV